MSSRTSKKKRDCPKLGANQFVRKDLCDERSRNISEKIDTMEHNLTEKLTDLGKKLDGVVTNREDEKKQKSRENRRALLAVLSGVLVALFVWGLAHIHF